MDRGYGDYKMIVYTYQRSFFTQMLKNKLSVE